MIVVTENPTRHIGFIREMEALKRNHQIRCSHYELQFSIKGNVITCAICGKGWSFLETRGFSNIQQVYRADQD
jgi:hypothetical protein